MANVLDVAKFICEYYKEISNKDIIEDSKKVRPFDSTWGMYYDEFDLIGELV